MHSEEGSAPEQPVGEWIPDGLPEIFATKMREHAEIAKKAEPATDSEL